MPRYASSPVISNILSTTKSSNHPYLIEGVNVQHVIKRKDNGNCSCILCVSWITVHCCTSIPSLPPQNVEMPIPWRLPRAINALPEQCNQKGYILLFQVCTDQFPWHWLKISADLHWSLIPTSTRVSCSWRKCLCLPCIQVPVSGLAFFNLVNPRYFKVCMSSPMPSCQVISLQLWKLVGTMGLPWSFSRGLSFFKIQCVTVKWVLGSLVVALWKSKDSKHASFMIVLLTMLSWVFNCNY